MELFQERGYSQTTVEGIANRAGLTERTFFRYFADKREVLFSGSKQIEIDLAAHIAGAPADATPLEAVAIAVEGVAASLQEQRDFAYVRARWGLVAKHAEIQERELMKLEALTTIATSALVARGVSELTASVTAEAGIAAFKIGFREWVAGNGARGFVAHVRAAFRVLGAVTSGHAKPKVKAKARS